jgi:hypothetical protein
MPRRTNDRIPTCPPDPAAFVADLDGIEHTAHVSGVEIGRTLGFA